MSTQPTPNSRQRRGVRLPYAAFRLPTFGTVLLAAWLLIPASLFAVVNPVALRCEYLQSPLGLDEPRPRLTWRVESSERGEKQTAYQIIVASDPSKLDS